MQFLYSYSPSTQELTTKTKHSKVLGANTNKMLSEQQIEGHKPGGCANENCEQPTPMDMLCIVAYNNWFCSSCCVREEIEGRDSKPSRLSIVDMQSSVEQNDINPDLFGSLDEERPKRLSYVYTYNQFDDTLSVLDEIDSAVSFYRIVGEY